MVSPFQFPSLPTVTSFAPCSYFLLCSGLNSFGNQLLLVEGWTCLEIAATKARLSSVTRPLNLLWEFLKLALFALQRSAGRGGCAIVLPADDTDWNDFSSNAACVGLKFSFVLSSSLSQDHSNRTKLEQPWGCSSEQIAQRSNL